MDVFKHADQYPSSFPPLGTSLDPGVYTPVIGTGTSGRLFVQGYLLGRNQAILQAIPGVTGVVSGLVVILLLVWLVVYAVSSEQGPRGPRVKAVRRFLKTELGVFLVLLFFYDLIADIPTVVNFVWAARGRMEMGPLCTFQGLVTELGFMGVVGCNFMVSKCTSDIILFSRTPGRVERIAGLVFVVAMPVILATIGPITTPDSFSYYGPAGVGCYQTIGSSYFQIILFTSGALTALQNISMFVVFALLRRKLQVRPGKGEKTQALDRRLGRVASQMLFYPISYLITTFLATISVLLTGFGVVVPHEFLILSMAVLTQAGIADVVIFLITRRSLVYESSSVSSSGQRSAGVVVHHPPTQLRQDVHELKDTFAKLEDNESSFGVRISTSVTISHSPLSDWCDGRALPAIPAPSRSSRPTSSTRHPSSQSNPPSPQPETIDELALGSLPRLSLVDSRSSSAGDPFWLRPTHQSIIGESREGLLDR